MVVDYQAIFRFFTSDFAHAKKSETILFRSLVGPLNERALSQGVQNWSQIQKLRTISQLTNQEARRLRYVGACQCRFCLKLAVT